jgi:hypothetical protein
MNDKEIAMTVEPAPPTPTTPVAPVPPVVATPRQRQGGRWLNVLLALAFAVALGGVAFAVGRSTAPVAAATGRGNAGFGFVPGGSFTPGGANGQGRGGLLGAGGGLTVSGTVDSIANGKLTVKLASGDTVTVTLDGSTTYRSATPSTAADVAVGDKVDVGLTGGRTAFGGGGGATSSAAPQLTARDVTVVP